MDSYLVCKLQIWFSSGYLRHYYAYVVDTLDHRFASSWYGYSTFCRVWQHFTGNLDWGPSHFSNLFYFRTPFAYEGSTLWGGNHQSEGDWGSGYCAGWDKIVKILKKYINVLLMSPNWASHLFELVAYESKCFEYGFCVAGDGDNSFGAASIADVYFCSTL